MDRPKASLGISFAPLTYLLLLLSFAVGCGSTSSPSNEPTTQPVAPVPFVNAPSPLTTPTYDGSGQGVEPTVIYFDTPWHGFSYWMAFSPYPNGDPTKENPSIIASEDGINWQVPPGLENPLALPDPALLADQTLFYDAASDQLWVYYIDTSAQTGILHVFRMVSSDGVHWQNQGVVFQVPVYDAQSPTVAKLGDTYYMWAVNNGVTGCLNTTSVLELRTSTDGMKWSDARPTNMSQPGFVVWHLNVIYVPSKQEFWAALTAYPTTSNCDHTVLFFATSQDGVNWTSYSKPILTEGKVWDNLEIYRSSFLYFPGTDLLKIWYSASSVQGAWHMGLTQDDYDEFLAWLQQ